MLRKSRGMGQPRSWWCESGPCPREDAGVGGRAACVIDPEISQNLDGQECPSHTSSSHTSIADCRDPSTALADVLRLMTKLRMTKRRGACYRARARPICLTRAW